MEAIYSNDFLVSERESQTNWTAIGGIVLLLIGVAILCTVGFFALNESLNIRREERTAKAIVLLSTNRPDTSRHATSSTNEEKKQAEQDASHVIGDVLPHDTTSDMVYDLYGHGGPEYVAAAWAHMKGMRDPKNPDYIVEGDQLEFPCTIVVRGKTFYANKHKAVRRAVWRHTHVQGQLYKDISQNETFTLPPASVAQATSAPTNDMFSALPFAVPGFNDPIAQTSFAGQPVPLPVLQDHTTSFQGESP